MCRFNGLNEFSKTGLIALIYDLKLKSAKNDVIEHTNVIKELVRTDFNSKTRKELELIVKSLKSKTESYGSYSKYAKDSFCN